MNLLLVERSEVEGDVVAIEGRRALHLRGVLGATVGSRVRAGVVGGALGTGEVIADDGTRIALRLALAEPASVPLPVDIVLALPRPKVLTRAVEALASFGVERIALTNAWRVDKSYLSTPRLVPEALALATRLGAEQGVTTHVPPITIHHRLMELLDTRFPERHADARNLVIAHPTGAPIEDVVDARPLVLAVGPEGGWIQRELDTFVARGFTAVSLGAPILRVETALAAALGQIMLLRRRAHRA